MFFAETNFTKQGKADCFSDQIIKAKSEKGYLKNIKVIASPEMKSVLILFGNFF